MADDLLSCPFCGGEAHLSDAEAGDGGLPRSARNPRCRECGADLGYCNTPQDAITAWNRRAPVPVPDEVRQSWVIANKSRVSVPSSQQAFIQGMRSGLGAAIRAYSGPEAAEGIRDD